MPKLKDRPPKYCRMNGQAVVYHDGRPHYLGRHGTPESKTAYARFIAEIQANPAFSPKKEEAHVSVRGLAAAFLDHAEANFDYTEYSHYRIIVLDFLDKLYGDGTPVDSFKPRCLKLVRTEMIQSHRFCRRVVNRYIHRIVSMFAWGVENELVPETTWRTLKVVKSLRKGAEGTYDNPPREPVPDDVIAATLPFLPPTVAAMVQVQRLTGMRPSEVFKMRVGHLDRSRKNGLWYYVPESHKTEEHIGKKPIPLGEPEQRLIAPYLIGKKPGEAVFSPRTAMAERNAVKRANRKTKIPPSQAARDRARAVQPSRYSEFYNRDSYRQAIEYAIKKGNRRGQEIPHWSPYLLRNSAATAIELEHGLDEAQAQLGHTTADMTKRYSKAQLQQREKLAQERHNPFVAEVEKL